MYFHIPKDVRVTYYNGYIVALNLISNQYIILPPILAEILEIALHNSFIKNSYKYNICQTNKVTLPKNFQGIIVSLQEKNILSELIYEKKYTHPPKKLKSSTGADNIDWRISHEDFNKKILKFFTLQAYYQLSKVYIILKFFGFSGLIKRIKKNTLSNFQIRAPEDFAPLVEALNRACFYFPIKTKCLEWSAALVFLGLGRKWRCNLEIGVQLQPFMAHAWVDVDGSIIADDPSLADTLSVILSEPFEREVV